jgi:hypothetical protein
MTKKTGRRVGAPTKMQRYYYNSFKKDAVNNPKPKVGRPKKVAKGKCLITVIKFMKFGLEAIIV